MNHPLRNVCAAFLAVMVCSVAFLTRAEAKAPPQEIPKVDSWQGAVADAKLLKSSRAPVYITDAKAWETMWKAWKLDGNPPEVDFKKEMLIIGITRGSSIQPNLLLDDKGDLKASWICTDDLKPGFRYLIVSIKKEGVKSVNGVALKE